MAYLALAWKFISSRPFLATLAAVGLWLFAQEWRAHRATAAYRATHYTTTVTEKSKTWETTRYVCGGGPVEFVGQLSRSEVERLAEEYGLVLVREVPGAERITTERVEVPVYVTEQGDRVRLFGERDVREAPWGAKALAGVKETGEFWLEVKPLPEPFTERLAQWSLWGAAYYGAGERSRTDYDASSRASGGLEVEIGGGYKWRRYGRWTITPAGEVGWSARKGVEGRLGLILTLEQQPLRLRAPRD